MQHRDPRPAADPYRLAIRGLRGPVVAAFLFSAVINVLMLTGSIYMLQVYDRVLSSGSVPTLLALFAIVVVLHGFLALFDGLRARLMARAGVRLDREVGARAFAHWIRPDAGRGAAGAPDEQPLRDLDTLRGFLGGGAAVLFDAPWVPLFLGVLFLIHPVLGWLALAGMGLAGALALLNHLVTRHAIGRSLLREGEERDLADRARRGAEVAAGMGMGPALAARWQERRDAALAAGQAAGDPSEVIAALSRATRMLLQSAILTAGAWLVIGGQISGGMIVASSILSGRALAPVDQIVGGWRGIRRAALAHRALAGLFARLPAEPARLHLPDPAGRLGVTGLTRLAGEGRPPVLDAVTFSLEPGDAVAVVGPSGSGKSTLARLLVGGLKADRGEVRLDGATFDQWEPARLGRHLGYLPQAPDALAGTAREIIARFDPDIPDESVVAAARLTGIHELILSLPGGYGTVIGGRGGHALSGGQAQRLGLARAVCGLPRLVVLDEPDAHLDTAGEAALARVIGVLRDAGSAVVVVAHRPGAMACVNKVLTLEAGRVAHFGDADARPAIGAARGPVLVPAVTFPDAPTSDAPTPDADADAMPASVATRMRRLAEQRLARRAGPADTADAPHHGPRHAPSRSATA